ncbi:MAG: hypothetical protein GXO65_07095 [Euryarchaeota archaeon]|nr:hypothetical protein [Euryarchaeota archaeon]
MIFLLIVGGILAGCAGAKETGHPAATPAPTTAAPAAVEPVEPTMQDECPICGMMPAKYSDWKAEIVFKDGTVVHFDSPKDMFKYLKGLDNMGMDKVWIKDPAAIAGAFVTDYSSKKYIEAKTAYYVKGSDAQGPMGADLVPFADHMDAMNFAKEHGGEVMEYKHITKDVLKGLKMKMGGMEGMDMGGMGEMKMVMATEPTMNDTCPICGMMPAKYPDWNAQIVFTDGSVVHFDSPKDMLKYYHGLDNMGMDKTWVEDPGTIKALYVKDHDSKEYIDAKTAHYVNGSDVQSPMGEDLVPFADHMAAMDFTKEHGGNIIGFDDITKDILKGLKMKMGGMEGMNMSGM